MRIAVVASVLMIGAAAAAAQPIDPYGPGPTPTGPAPAVPVPVPSPVAPPAAPVAPDVEIDEAVAQGLLARARELRAEQAYADAKALVLEAIARRPDGPTHAAARLLLDELNALLGVVTAPPPRPPDPIAPPVDVRPPVLDELDEPPPLAPIHDPASKARLITSGAVWGGIAGGMFADVVSGLEDTTGADVAVGVGLGAVGGGVAAAILRDRALTRGDAALIDSVSLWGTEAALAFAFALAPPETEAYTLNGTLGAIGGYLIGHVAARSREISAGRLVKVDAIATAGALAPWLLYAMVKDDNVDDDEQAFGWLSMAGLGAGIYFGFRWTSDPPARGAIDDAPPAVVRRSSTGSWSVGGPALAPIGRPGEKAGVAVTVLGGRW